MRSKFISVVAGLGLAFAGLTSALAQPIKFALCYDLSKSYGLSLIHI